jgi:cytochrome c-type biogenesis protein CcmE
MKAKTVIGVALLIGFTSLLFMNFGQQVGAYMDFEQASESGAKAHVVGTWMKDMDSRYDPAQNVFVFYMQDDAGNVRQVNYSNPKPANFEDAEKLVIEGVADGEIFQAENILVKCPSKYNADAPADLQST